MSITARSALPAAAPIWRGSLSAMARLNCPRTSKVSTGRFPLSLHMRRFASSSASSSSLQSSSPLVVYSLQLPRLSPSMSHGRITAFHVQRGATVAPASLVFTLTTDSLLESAGSSHTMSVESHDPGVVGWLDDSAVDSGRQVAVGRVLGWMWEDEDAMRDGRDRQDEVHRLVHEAAEADAAVSGGAKEANGIRVKPFVWQAFVAESERTEDESAARRKK